MSEEMAKGLIATTYGGDMADVTVKTAHFGSYSSKHDFDIVFEVGEQEYRCCGWARTFKIGDRTKAHAERRRNAAISVD